MKSKGILYNGAMYKVPMWVKFMTTDNYGTVFGWSHKPTIDRKFSWIIDTDIGKGDIFEPYYVFEKIEEI